MTDNLYITNYCNKNCSPLASITRLPIAEAYALAEKLSQYAGETFTSFSRFRNPDFDGYYKKRVRTEKWLYNSFVALGGKPENTAPVYFVLGESNYLNDWFENGTRTALLLKDIDSSDISFTFGDSMAKIDSKDRMDPFTKESLFNFIYKSSTDIVSFLNKLNKQNIYIEAQLWNDIYVKKLAINN